MAKGDRGRRGRGEYGRTERSRGHERRERENRASERRESQRSREKEKKEKEKEKESKQDENDRYESGGEASNPDLGHSGDWGSAKDYKDQESADRGEQARRDRERKERARDKMRQREAFRRQKAADKASGGLGGTTEYGRAITDAEIDAQMEADAYNRAADDAWNSGNYGSWLGNSMAGTAKGVINNLSTEFNDFSDSPLDYTADITRNPYVGAALAITAPPLALGAAALKAADSVTDYFQGEATGEQALKQGALDVAGAIQNQGLATMASFIGDPTGTTSDILGGGLGNALAKGGIGGAALAAVAPSIVGGVLEGAIKDSANLSPKEKRELKEASAKRRAEMKEGKEDKEQVSLSGAGGVSLGGAVNTQSGGRGMYMPNQNWQVGNMEMYGVQQMPEVTPSISTKALTSGKIDTKAKKALTLAQQYPWMFDQGILSTGRNPYAVTQ